MALHQPSKLRILSIIFAGGMGIYFLLNMFTGGPAIVESKKMKISSPPALDSVPGSVKDNARYKELQEKDNEKRANDAKKSGKTTLPTLVNKTNQQQSDEEFFKDLKKPLVGPEASQPKEDPLKKAQDDAERRLKDQQARLDKLKKEQEDKRKQSEMARLEVKKNQQGAKELEAKIAGYLTDMNSITKVYAPAVKQNYVAGPPSSSSTVSSSSVAQGASRVPPLYKAGTVIYGVIESAYNSDNPGPILARITTGPLAGSRIIGTVSETSDWATGLSMTFNTLSRPLAGKSQSITLRAVEPSSLEPAVATTVNNHYGQKYGALLVAGALTQGSQQAQNSPSGGSSSSSSASSSASGSSSSGGSGGNSGDNSTKSASPSGSGAGMLSIVTPISTDIISNLNKVASRPATYRIEQGTAVGLLFINDFILEA